MTTWDSNNMGSKGGLSGSSLVFTNDSGSDGWVSVLSSDGKTSGKWYFEIYYEDLGGNEFALVGVGNVSADLDSYIGSDANGWGYRTNNRYYNDGSFVSGAGSWVGGDAIGVALDMDNGKIWFRDRNGNWDGDPAAGTGEAYSGLSGTIYAAASLYDADGQITLRAEDDDFDYAAPSGFTAYGSTGATYTALEDVSLDLAAYHQARSDLATLLEAAYLLGLEDLAMALETWAFDLHDLPTVLQTAKIGRHDLATALDAVGGYRQDLAMLLSAVSPLVRRDLRLFLTTTDGNARQDLTLALGAIQKAPAFRSVIAQRLVSVKKGAV